MQKWEYGVLRFGEPEWYDRKNRLMKIPFTFNENKLPDIIVGVDKFKDASFGTPGGSLRLDDEFFVESYNSLGSYGWEMVSIDATLQDAHTLRKSFIFKRPIE